MRIVFLLLLSPCGHAAGNLRSQDFASATQLLVGNSTSPAGAPFEVRPSTALKAGDYILAISSANGSAIFVVTEGGRIAAKGAAPVISSCGTTPNGSVVGNDVHGTITVGGGAVLSCTLTFSVARTNVPDCVLSDNSTAITGDISAVSATAFTASFSASLGGGKIYYHCLGD